MVTLPQPSHHETQGHPARNSRDATTRKDVGINERVAGVTLSAEQQTYHDLDLLEQDFKSLGLNLANVTAAKIRIVEKLLIA